MKEVRTLMIEVDLQVGRATAAVVMDQDSSKELASAVGDLNKKSTKVVGVFKKGTDEEIKESVIHLNKRGENAANVAQKDQYVNAGTRQAVLDACKAVNYLKSKMS